MSDEERKIITDEDWKARVQREKEEAQRKAEAEKAQASEEGKAESSGPAGEEAQGGGESGDLFMSLVGSLVTQAMYALGMVQQQEGQEQVQVDITTAKQLIDMLVMLRSKTQGNLTSDESSQLNEAISELQRVFVARQKQVQEAKLRQSGVHPEDLKGSQGQ
ncbi:MAG: DUF1844 domain-containing protein [Candidatus Hydrogenedentota bacterium]